MKTRYKFLRLKDGKKVSQHGNLVWRKGKWEKIKGSVELCERGLHCSVRMFDALSYVPGDIVARVEVRGKSDIQDDKEAWSEMRLVDVRKWRKQDSVALSIFAAERVIENYEKQYPNDDRPRKAIEAARLVLEKDTAANRQAARSAAESAAESAWSAAQSAAESAWSAAESAWSAARSAAESAAESAARSAWSAARSAAESAWSAARSAAIEEINAWMEARFEELPKL